MLVSVYFEYCWTRSDGPNRSVQPLSESYKFLPINPKVKFCIKKILENICLKLKKKLEGESERKGNSEWMGTDSCQQIRNYLSCSATEIIL